LLGHRQLDVAAHVLGLVELRLLRQIPDLGPLRRPRLALKILLNAGHDAQQARLPRAVGAEDADLRAGIEREPDVVENHSARRNNFPQGLHYVDELWGHWVLRGEVWSL